MYYVYTHVDPVTHEVVYVGKGINGRAWDVTRSRGGNKDHQLWMSSLSKNGYLPSDWVRIIYRNLTEKEAFSKEKQFLHEYGVTKFNRQCGEKQHQSKIDNEQAKEVFYLAWINGLSRSSIAKYYGLCPTNVSMIKHKRQWKSVLSNETNPKYEESLI
jgi:hypothetical protein